MPTLLPRIGGLSRAYWILWTASLINRVGTFVAPFLSLYLTEQRHFSVEQTGMVVGLFGAGKMAAGPVGGWMADHLGRRRALGLGTVVAAGAMLLLGAARAPGHIVVAAGVLGFAGDLYRPALQAQLADVVPSADRDRAYGFLHWGANVGFALASVIGGAMARGSYQTLFVVDAATTLALGCIVYFNIAETRPTPRDAAAAPGPRSPGFTAPYRDRLFVAHILLSTCFVYLFMQSVITLPIDMGAHGLSPADFGMLIAINGVMIVLLQPFSIAAMPRFSRFRVIAASALLTGVGFGLTAFAHGAPGYALSIAVWTLGEIVGEPVASALSADLSPPLLRGSYAGAYQISFGAASLLAPVVGGLILGRLGAQVLWASCLAIGLAVAAGYLATAGRTKARIAALIAEAQD